MTIECPNCKCTIFGASLLSVGRLVLACIMCSARLDVEPESPRLRVQ